MPASLLTIPFSRELLSRVRHFHCGDTWYDREVCDWITSEDSSGAVACLERGECEVWLYQDDAGELVGFSSLGKARWKWPSPSTKTVTLNIIPFVAVHANFQGKPVGPASAKYSTQIMNHLIERARTYRRRQPYLGLYVAPENTAAIRFYDRFGFIRIGVPRRDIQSARIYQKMVVPL